MSRTDLRAESGVADSARLGQLLLAEHTRKRAHQMGIAFIFLPVGSPHLNPIKPIWKSLKWEASPLIVESAVAFRALVDALFDQLTDKLSFASSWIDKFLDFRLQFLS